MKSFLFCVQQERLPKPKRMYRTLVNCIKYSRMKCSAPVNSALCMVEFIVRRIAKLRSK